VQKGVHESPGMHARTRVHNHAGGLIDGHDVRVFVQDGERYLLRGCMERGRLGGIDVDRIARAHGVGCALRAAVDQHAAALDPGLNARAANVRQALMQRVIQALAGILLIQLDSQARASVTNCAKRVVTFSGKGSLPRCRPR
jgi:hypothetical protein